MPFQSEKQRRYLHANHPEIAKRWEKEYATGGISNHFRKKLGDGTSLSDYLETPKYLDAFSQAHYIGTQYPSNVLATDKYSKQGTSSDVRHTLGSAATKDALIDWVSNRIGVDPHGKVADVIGNLGITAATAKEEIPDAWRSVKQAFKEKDYGAITSGDVFAQPWEDVKANLNVWGIPYGASLEEKITAALPTEDEFWGGEKVSVKDKIQSWKDKKRKNEKMMTDLNTRFAEMKADAEAKEEIAKQKDAAEAAAVDAVAAAQVRANIQTYGNRDRPNEGMNAPGGGKGQSPTGGDVAGTPFNRGGVARKNYFHGGILGLNESEEIISDDGNDIELTAYNAAFDDPKDLSTGVKTLFQAKDGGRIGFFTGMREAEQKQAQKDTGGGYQSVHDTGAVTQTPGRRTAQTVPSGINIHKDPDRIPEAFIMVDGQEIPQSLWGTSSDPRENPLRRTHYGANYKHPFNPNKKVTYEQKEVLNIIKKNIDGKWQKYIDPTLTDQLKMLSGLTGITGILTAIFKQMKTDKEMREMMKLMEDIGLAKGPPGTNDPLYDQLWLYQEKKKAKYRKDDEPPDRPEPIYDPRTGAVGEEYAQGYYGYPDSDLDRIRAGQAKRAMINPDWQEQPGLAYGQQFFNSGGLANLFRVKNQ